MVGNKIIAAIRSDGNVYPYDDGFGFDGGVTGGSVLNTNSTQYSTFGNVKMRLNSGSSQYSRTDNQDIGMGNYNNRIQTTVMDLGKKLLQCARNNDFKGVESMIAKGAPVASDWLGMTAIHFAAMNNWYDICKLLLTSGVNKDGRTKVDRTPLHFAAFYGHEKIVQLLIDSQCIINPRDMLRMTPLHWAVEKKHKNIVRILLKHNADVTAISKFGKTPIALAVVTEQADILHELEIARQAQQTKKYDEQHEKETNEAVNSIMGETNDYDEPVAKKVKTDNEKLFTNHFRISIENMDQSAEENPAAVNLLKSHGISIMKDDEDTSNNLLTTALQNGRQLVLSEGGKMLLNEAKKMSSNQIPTENLQVVPSQQQSNKNSYQVKAAQPTMESKFRPNIITKTKESPSNSNNEKYKNIRIISLNDFKKLYGNGNLKTLQKLESTSNRSQIIKIKTDESKELFHRKIIEEKPELVTCDEVAENTEEEEDDDDTELPPNIIKFSPESDQDDTSDEIENVQTQHHPSIQTLEVTRQTPSAYTNPVRHSFTKSPSITNTETRTPVIPLLTIPEICRQLLELRKQNEELRRKYEIAQKEKEEFRNRLKRLEVLLMVDPNNEEYV